MKNFYEVKLFSFRNILVCIQIRRVPAPRGPYETGAGDRYYGRPYDPRYTDWWGRSRSDLTPAQAAEYRQGWDEEEDRKDWGA